MAAKNRGPRQPAPRAGARCGCIDGDLVRSGSKAVRLLRQCRHTASVHGAWGALSRL